MIVDLAQNTVDGRKVMPRVCELAQVLNEAGGSLPTSEVIIRMYGVAEPQDAYGALRCTAYLARRAGIPIAPARAGRNGSYRLG